MGEYLKKAYLTLVKKDKGNHDGQSDLSSNGDLIFALAMQNYNKAHKLKFKATKKQQKMLRQLDGDSDNKSNSSSKDKDSNKNNKSQGEKCNENSGKKGKCSKCGKWEAIPLRSVHPKNHLTKPKKRTWLQLVIMDLKEG